MLPREGNQVDEVERLRVQDVLEAPIDLRSRGEGGAPLLGPAPGAVILRSDEIRKRQAGLAPTEHARPEAYGPAADAAVFDELFATAETLLRVGRAVVLDATFLRSGLRSRAEALAQAAGVAFHGLWLEAPGEVLEPRVARRRVEGQRMKIGASGIVYASLDLQGMGELQIRVGGVWV